MGIAFDDTNYHFLSVHNSLMINENVGSNIQTHPNMFTG